MQVVDEKQQLIYSALKQLGPGWHTRAEIAALLSKKKLNQSETTLLDVLASDGFVEKEMRQAALAHIQQCVYKVKE